MDYIEINKLLTKSIYKQIAESISLSIQNGVLKYNDKLPTEKEICQMFSISQTAVKMAYETLINDGLIKRIKGKGTYVTNRKTFKTDIKSFSTLEYDEKMERSIVLLEKSDKDSSALRELKLGENEKYYLIGTLYRDDSNNQSLFQRAYIPENMFLKLDQKKDDFVNIYELIENQYNYSIKQMHSTFTTVNASPSEALLLGLENDAALYLIRTIVVDDNDNVVAYLCNYYPGAFTEFEVVVYAN